MLIDDFCEGWLDELDLLASKQAHACLLLDGAFHPNILALARQWPVDVPETNALFHGTPGSTAETLSASPWILPYVAHDDRLRTLLRSCNGFPMVSLIISSETPGQIARRLAPWCVVRCGDSHFNFRFPDTRRLPTILSVLDDEQLGSLTGPAHSWHYVGRNGQWCATEIGKRPLAGDDSARPPALTDRQFGLLVGDSEADEILSMLTPDLQPETQAWKPSARYETVNATLIFADVCRFFEQGDRLDLCAQALISENALQRMKAIRERHPDATARQLVEEEVNV